MKVEKNKKIIIYVGSILFISSLILIITGKVNLSDVMGNTAQGEYVCPTGYTFQKSNKTCTKTTKVNAVLKYTCPTGYKKSGNTCVKTTSTKCPTNSKKYDNTTCKIVKYECPKTHPETIVNGQKKCAKKKYETTYICDKGWVSQGDINKTKTCYKKTAICNGTINGNSCMVKKDYDTKTCPAGYTRYWDKNQGKYKCRKLVVEYKCIGGSQYGTSKQSCINSKGKRFNAKKVYSYKYIDTIKAYNWVKENIKYKTETKTATKTTIAKYETTNYEEKIIKKVAMVCPTGYTKKGQTCYAYANKKSNYHCSTGKLQGKMCVQVSTVKATKRSSNENQTIGNTNNNSINNQNNSTPTNILVSQIQLNQKNNTYYLNDINNISIGTTVYPSNATNKKLMWSSSNSSIATVDSYGKVIFKKPGVVTITAKATDGSQKSSSVTFTIKKKIIILTGASLATNIKDNVRIYKGKNNYSVDNGTLYFVNKSGSKHEWMLKQEGWKTTNNIFNSYNDSKSYVEFHLFFQVVGNSMVSLKCSEISSTTPKVVSFVNDVNANVNKLTTQGYNVKGYIISLSPVTPSKNLTTGKVKDNVASNTSANACNAGIRSNWKYYTINRSVVTALNNCTNCRNISYIKLFQNIMNTNGYTSATGKRSSFSYDKDYKTVDGVHYTSQTAKDVSSIIFKLANL